MASLLHSVWRESLSVVQEQASREDEAQCASQTPFPKGV